MLIKSLRLGPLPKNMVFIKQIHTFTSNILFEQRRFGLGRPSLYQVKSFIKSNGFDLIKAGATQTETSLLKQYVAGERVDLLDDYDFPARTITETWCSFPLDFNRQNI